MTATLRTTGQIAFPAVDVAQLVPGKAALRHACNVALFLVSPFIGLVYAMLLPFVGLAMMAVIGGKALSRSPAAWQVLFAVRKIALLGVAPFIGLVYAVLMPFVGIAVIARIGYQACQASQQAV
jgi:hypothetical protein